MTSALCSFCVTLLFISLLRHSSLHFTSASLLSSFHFCVTLLFYSFATLRLCPSTARCSPPLKPSIVVCLQLPCCRWFPPTLLCFLATFCLVILIIFFLSLVAILYCVQRMVHLLSFILASLLFYIILYDASPCAPMCRWPYVIICNVCPM